MYFTMSIAKKYMKKNKARIFYLIIIIAISLSSVLSYALASKNQSHNSILFKQKYSPIYDAQAIDIDYSNAKKIQLSPLVKKAYISESNRIMTTSDGFSVEVSGYNQESLKLNKLNLVRGRYPEKNGEACILDGTNRYSIGDVIDGEVITQTKSSGKNNIISDHERLKIVGILENKKQSLEIKGNRDKVFAIFNNTASSEIIPYNVLIMFNAKNKNTEAESNKLTKQLGMKKNEIHYNKVAFNENKTFNSIFEDSPNTKILIYASILFPLLILFVGSRDVFKDIALLRILGATKKQSLTIFTISKIFIIAISYLLTVILSYSMVKFYYMNYINMTLESDDVFKVMDKGIILYPEILLISLGLLLIPFILIFIYDAIVINKKGALSLLNKYSGISRIGRIVSKTRLKVRKKIFITNILMSIVLLLIPIFMLSQPVYRNTDLYNGAHFDTNKSPRSLFFLDREYNMENKMYISPFESKLDYDILKKIESDRSKFKNIIARSEQIGYIVSDGNLFLKEYLNGDDFEGNEIYTNINAFDSRYLENTKIVGYDKNNPYKDSNYPVIYVRDGIYDKFNQSFTQSFKNLKKGDFINIKVPFKSTSGKYKMKYVKCIVGGIVSSIEWSNHITTPVLSLEIITDLENMKKIFNKTDLTNIYFDYSGENINKDLNEILRSYMYSITNRDEAIEEDMKYNIILRKESALILVYLTILCVISIYSSMSIIIEQREISDRILLYLGESKKALKNRYIKEGAFYGFTSGLVALGFVIYSSLFFYMLMVNFDPNYKIVFSVKTSIIAIIYCMLVFMATYLVAIRRKLLKSN